MAFATNSSVFGIKPAAQGNTSIFGTANNNTAKSPNPLFGSTQPASTGLFGQTPQQQQQPASTGLFGQQQQQQPQQQQQSTGLFGQPLQQQNQPASTSLFGQSSQQSQPQSTSLFGNPQQQQQQPPQTGLFGQPAQQQQQQPASTGLFGQPNQQQQQQPVSTGLFGQQQQQQPASTGLFGQPAQQQPATTGLFSQPTQQQQQPAATGLFGQSIQQQPSQSTGLFGQPTQNKSLFSAQNNTQPAQSNIFGNFGASLANSSNQQQPGQWGSSTLQSQPTLHAGNPGFGNSGTFNSGSSTTLFNQSQKTPIGFGNAQSSGQPPFTKLTKFNDLPDDLKKVFEQIDSHIQGRILISKELHQQKLGEEITKGEELLRSVRKELASTASTIRSDALLSRDLKAKSDQAVLDTIAATRIVEAFRNPQQSSGYLKSHASFPLEFFSRITGQMRERLQWYKSTIEQIEQKLSTASQAQHGPQAISTTLQAQHATFLALANKTANLDAEVQRLKALYTQLWRAKTGSVRDPFREGDREGEGDLGLSTLDLK